MKYGIADLQRSREHSVEAVKYDRRQQFLQPSIESAYFFLGPFLMDWCVIHKGLWRLMDGADLHTEQVYLALFT